MDIFATLQNVLGQGGGHMDVYYTTLLPNSTFGENLEIKLQGYSLSAVLGLRCGARASHCSHFSCSRARAPRHTSVAAAYRLCCPTARGLLPEQWLNPSPLHRQADSSLDFAGDHGSPAGLLSKVLFENVSFLWTIPPKTMSTSGTAAAAPAKPLQPCPTVRPQRRQPTRLPVPGILQARTLEWVAISYIWH